MRTIQQVLEALLDTLPKCHGCAQPATKMMMSKHVPIPNGAISVEHGKSFHYRPYAGASAGAPYHTPTDGTWQCCCDDHPMPESMEPLGSWDFPVAGAIRDARAVLNPKGTA